MRAPSLTRLAAVVVVAGALGVGCGGDGSDEGEADSTSDSEAVGELTPVPDALESLAEAPPGQGVGVIGIQELSFTVVACHDGPEPGDTPEATVELRLEGSGEMTDGPFDVEITRYLSDTGDGEPVVTETARVLVDVDGETRGIEAKRSTSGADGAWLDLADPEATTPLIERQGAAVDVRGTFGPEGARAGDDGLEQGRIRATCPP